MKTKVFYLATKITVAVILVAILVVEATASGNSKLKMVPYASERAIIAMENNSNLTSELTIEDASGDVVYYKEGSITEGNYSKKFDFANLRNGHYKVTVSNKNGKNELHFTVKNKTIRVNSDAAEYEPYVDIKEDVLKLSILNNSLNEVSLTVSNNDGVVYRKSLGNDFSINAGFSLALLESGDYAINIINGDRTYSYDFNK
jgi:hypothetical protein